MPTIRETTFALAAPAGRKPGTDGHRSAARSILARFEGIGLSPYAGDGYVLAYAATVGTAHGGRGKLVMENLIGVIPGADRALPPTLIGAHYDSVLPSPCADDNAAAVAVMLHVAERIAASPLQRDVVIAAFDGEEPPFFLTESMGSTRFVTDHLEQVHLAIIMDLIAHPFPLPGKDPHVTAITGIESHPDLAQILEGSQLPVVAVRNELVGDMSDHHAFRMIGYPYLFLSSGEWEDYHTDGDTPDKIDYGKAAAVAVEVERLARAADGLVLGESRPHDIRGLEMSTLNEHLGEDLVRRLGGTPQAVIRAVRSLG